jgi:hypothetical protein
MRTYRNHQNLRRSLRNSWLQPSLAALWLAVCLGAAQAQQTTLAKPSRTAFKCVVGKSTVYSDAPCVGAERVDLQPTRGFSKSSGKERVGADVQREHYREQVAEALRPLTGKSDQEFDKSVRRFKLTAAAKEECSSLDSSIGRTEAEERAATPAERAVVQRKLFGLRVRYRQLAC